MIAVTKNLFGWSKFHAPWKIEFNSYALRTRAGVWVVDPVRPGREDWRALQELGAPVGIFLTNANHDRDAGWLRQQFDVQIYAHEAAPADCDTKIDVLVLDGETLPGGVKALHLPGAGAGETALYAKTDGGTLLLGDVLVNTSGRGPALLPEQFLEDRDQAIASLHRLRDITFQVATFAHGAPLTKDAKAHITKLLKQLGKPKRKP
jgi:hypothetical protein